MSFVRFAFAVTAVLTFCVGTQVQAADAHSKPKRSSGASEIRKRLETEGKSKKQLNALPDFIDTAFHLDHHFAKDGIKAIYSVGPNLWWVEVTEGGKDYLLEYDNKGVLQAIAWENPNGVLVILVEGDDGYLWAVDENGNAVPL